MFKIMRADYAARKIFLFFSTINAICIPTILVFSEIGYLPLAALLFCILSIGLNCLPRYQKSPFSLLLSYFVTLFLVVPLTFISFAGSSYQYGNGLARVPNSDSFYGDAAPIAIGFLIVCMAAVVAGLLIGSRLNLTILLSSLNRSKAFIIWFVCLIVAALTYLSNESFLSTYSSGEAGQESLLVFIFFDHSYLVLVSIVFFSILSRSSRFSRAKIKLQFIVVIALFLIISILATSKGFILVLFFLSFLVPVSYLMRDKRNLVYFPTSTMIIVAIPLALMVFFYSYYTRSFRQLGGVNYTANILEVMNSLGDDAFIILANNILYRISAALDRYLLIFAEFILSDYSFEYSIHYLTYLAKNFLNLILPGTPFQEAYTPSGNYLYQVLTKQSLYNSDITKVDLVRNLNTQPFTLPGTVIILFGYFSPLVLFLLTLLFSTIYSHFDRMYIRIGLLYCFFLLLSSYGVEIAIATSIHFTLSLFLMMHLVRLLSRVRL